MSQLSAYVDDINKLYVTKINKGLYFMYQKTKAVT